MSASVRAIRRVHYARPHAVTLPRLLDGDEWDDNYDDYDDEWSCTHCGGEGYREVDDPLWDNCDEFGYGPCSSCRGTGLRSRQFVF